MVNERSDGLRSPRTNLQRLLKDALGESSHDTALLSEHIELLQQADAENKLRHGKLYLVLDLDETLVYSQRLQPGASPKGTQISVRGSPFDVVTRPGLRHFLQTVSQKFILYLYTMGDEEYTRAAMEVIDPGLKLFTGGICCWRQGESRTHKALERVVCDKSMALIVDDSPDVWSRDLANLCLVRRFVGDAADDGLQQLCSKLLDIHRLYYDSLDSLGGDAASFSLDASSPPPPDIRNVLGGMRGDALRGCSIALTGVVAEQTQETLAQQPLAILVRLLGGTVTTGLDEATHLVARQKDGWKQSQKIRRAAQRSQVDGSFSLVWDHWLLDTLCTWERQPEAVYAVPTDGLIDRVPAAASLVSAAAGSAVLGGSDRLSHILGLGQQIEKRPREQNNSSEQAPASRPRVHAPASQRSVSVADYLKGKVGAAVPPTAAPG